MKVLHGLPAKNLFTQSAVTVGAFDGVHVAHKRILQRLIQLSKDKGLPSVVLTFWPHPAKITRPNDPLPLLTDMDEKTAILNSVGIDYFVILPFTDSLSQLPAYDFIKDILVDTLKAKQVVIGYDHRFGHSREGDIHFLKAHSSELGFEVVEIQKQWIDDAKISSTQIRKLLLDGQIQKANFLLGHAYSLSGAVIEGQKLGRTLGFPTANIQISTHDKLIPAYGVYIAEAEWQNNKYKAVVNIGTKPTVNGQKLSVECHLLDFRHHIYNQKITLFLLEKIRNEQKFDSLETLKAQISADVHTARLFFNVLSEK